MLILPADADEALVSTAVDRIAKAVEPGGGSVNEIDRWGRRRFAYELDRQHEGYYVVLRFTGEPSVQPELDRVLNIADEVIRHKILVAPPKPVPKAEGERPARERPGRERPVRDDRARDDRTRDGERERTASPAPA
jgi:small subunit ribosomal protein S6